MGLLSPERATQALQDLRRTPIETVKVESLMERIWELRHNLTPYDASYVALAERLGAALVTGDVRMAKAPGITASISLV